jgi:uncharacterized protein
MPDVAREQGYLASARVDLMGEIKADDAGAPRFLRGVTEYPPIGDRSWPSAGMSCAWSTATIELEPSASVDCNRMQASPPMSTLTNC